MNFQLSVIDTERHIFEGEASKLTIPAMDGVMTVLAEHMSVVTPVGIGEVVVEAPDKTINLTIGKGLFSMHDNAATLLIEDASYTEEISEARAEEAKKKAEELIVKGVTGADMEAAMATIRRSLLDLRVVRRRKTTRI